MARWWQEDPVDPVDLEDLEDLEDLDQMIWNGSLYAITAMHFESRLL